MHMHTRNHTLPLPPSLPPRHTAHTATLLDLAFPYHCPHQRPSCHATCVQVYEAVEHVLYLQTSLLYNRHLDQIILSALYGYCKVHKLNQVMGLQGRGEGSHCAFGVGWF